MTPPGRLFAVSDLHAAIAANHALVDRLRPESPYDWLIVAGDVAEVTTDIERTLRQLARRFAKVIWAPGNHELWTVPDDPVQLNGDARYRYLVELCRHLGIATPEDPYPVWQGAGGPARIAPLLVLYDYSFRLPEDTTKELSLARAHATGVVCTDEYMLRPDPYPSRDAWCRARVAYTEKRLGAAADSALPLVLVNHYPLLREPTRLLRHQEFAQWCGTELTASWHCRYPTIAVVYGHLHIPRTSWQDGVRFEEVSLGYPREWHAHGHPRGLLRQILPGPGERL